MGVGFAPTWLRQVNPLVHKTTLTIASIVPQRIGGVAELVGSCYPIHACRGLPNPKCLFDPSGLSLCLPGDHFCTVPVDDVVLFHSMVSEGGLVGNTTVPGSGGSGLCAGCDGIHFFSLLLHPQT